MPAVDRLRLEDALQDSPQVSDPGRGFSAPDLRFGKGWRNRFRAKATCRPGEGQGRGREGVEGEKGLTVMIGKM